MIHITDEAIEQIRQMQGEIERLRGMVEILRVQRDGLISQLGKAHACLRQIIEADDEFRMTLPDDWEGDPISDAVAAAKYLLSDEYNGPEFEPPGELDEQGFPVVDDQGEK